VSSIYQGSSNVLQPYSGGLPPDPLSIISLFISPPSPRLTRPGFVAELYDDGNPAILQCALHSHAVCQGSFRRLVTAELICEREGLSMPNSRLGWGKEEDFFWFPSCIILMIIYPLFKVPSENKAQEFKFVSECTPRTLAA
jgi:hypothetical protein